MMDRQELLDKVRELSAMNLVSREEVLEAYDQGQNHIGSQKYDHVLTSKIGISDLLYYIGGAIVFFGIAIFIAQNWTTINTPTKLIATLGVSIMAFICARLFDKQENTRGIATGFDLISALVAPFGFYVLLDTLGLRIESSGSLSVLIAILFLVYLASFIALRRTLYLLFSILLATAFYFSFTNWLVEGNGYFQTSAFFEYRLLLAGLAYITLGYYFSQTTRRVLTGFLYSFGVLGFLGSAMALGGWSPNQNIFWEIFFPFCVFGVIFASVFLQSRSFLTFGALFLMGYIMKITGEYFSAGLGWPLALVLAGLLLIAVGYGWVYVNREYINKKALQ
jgi:hypothetical protein